MNSYNIDKIIDDEIVIEKTVYNYEFKMDLKKKIEQIKNKKSLTEIFLIIKNDDKGYVDNKSGIFMYIHELKNSTYKQLVNYLKKHNYY